MSRYIHPFFLNSPSLSLLSELRHQQKGHRLFILFYFSAAILWLPFFHRHSHCIYISLFRARPRAISPVRLSPSLPLSFSLLPFSSLPLHLHLLLFFFSPAVPRHLSKLSSSSRSASLSCHIFVIDFRLFRHALLILTQYNSLSPSFCSLVFARFLSTRIFSLASQSYDDQRLPTTALIP